MSRIAQLIAEIREIGSVANHRNSIQVHRILDGNRALFLTQLEAENFIPIVKRFEALADSSAKEFQSEYFKQDYNRQYELLLFYLNRL